MIFKCVNCGGNVIFDPEKENMFCPHCDGRDCQEEKFDHAEMTVCPNCGGEVKVKEHTAALQCEYCGDYIILDERVENHYEPQKMIRFKIDKERVKGLIRERFKKQIFTPTDFLSEARLNKMQGEYVPFFLYDYRTRGRLDAKGIKVRVWISGNTEYTERAYFHVEREMNLNYNDIPADASIPMPDQIMDLLEPYDYSGLCPFDKKYLSGFYGEKYNLEAGVLEPRAREKMEKSAMQKLQSTVSGYTQVVDEHRNITILDSKREYTLFPVWKYDYTYNGNEYPFYVNGQTGKIVGKVPTSTKKVLAYSATLWAVLTTAMMMISFIIGTM